MFEYVRKMREKLVSNEDVDFGFVGFYWHVHHDQLMEWCHSYKERAGYIRREKRQYETDTQIGTRFRLFKPVRSNLPQELIKLGRAYSEALRARVEALRARDEAGRRALSEAWRARVEAERAYNEARRAHDEAIKKHAPEIEKLHRQECLDCPWDGRTIFPV